MKTKNETMITVRVSRDEMAIFKQKANEFYDGSISTFVKQAFFFFDPGRRSRKPNYEKIQALEKELDKLRNGKKRSSAKF